MDNERTELRSLPTELNGRVYRSLLEAKWASFFTDIGWEFEYEPGSFNGWLPDFAIRPLDKKGKTLYIEVKPTFDFPEDAALKAIMAVVNSELSEFTGNMKPMITRRNMKRSISRAFKQTRILLVGYRPIMLKGHMSMGWISRPNAEKIITEDQLYDDGPEYAFCPFECDYLWPRHLMNDIDITNIWNRSANKVQWNPVENIGLTINGEPL